MAQSYTKPGLIRALGLWAASSVVVGTVIGSGIFLVANDMTAGVGTPARVFLVWILGGALTLAGALAYAELGAMLPEAGAEYVYLREAYGPLWGFLYGWMQVLVAKPGSLATLGAGFALYFTFFFPSLNLRLVAFSIIVVLGVVNYFGVRTSGAVQTIFTVLKVSLILALAVAGLASGRGDWSHFQTAVPVKNALAGLVAALVGALWAYDGWNNVSLVAGEVDRPERNLPLALAAGTAVVGALYLLANLAYFYILPAADVAASTRVAADVAQRFLGNYGGGVVALAAMVSIFAAINGSILGGSRIPFAMSTDGLFFRKLAEIHPRYHCPSDSVIALCGLGALVSLTGTYSQLYTYVIFAEWVFYGMTAAGVFALRRKHPEWPRPYRTWGYPLLPAVFVLVSAALSVLILFQNPARSLVGLLLMVAGVPAYFYWRRSKAVAAKKGLPLVLLLACVTAVVPSASAARPTSNPTVMVFALNDSGALASLAKAPPGRSRPTTGWKTRCAKFCVWRRDKKSY